MFRQILLFLLCFIIFPSYSMDYQEDTQNHPPKLPGIRELFADALRLKWQCPTHPSYSTNSVTGLLKHINDYHVNQAVTGVSYRCLYHSQCSHSAPKPLTLIHHLAKPEEECGHNAFTICCKRLWVKENYGIHKGYCRKKSPTKERSFKGLKNK